MKFQSIIFNTFVDVAKIKAIFKKVAEIFIETIFAKLNMSFRNIMWLQLVYDGHYWPV